MEIDIGVFGDSFLIKLTGELTASNTENLKTNIDKLMKKNQFISC